MNTMKLLSVNVGTVQPTQHGKPSGKTGIFKTPRAALVQVTPLGLEGEATIDTRNHGGLDQAVYVAAGMPGMPDLTPLPPLRTGEGD